MCDLDEFFLKEILPKQNDCGIFPAPTNDWLFQNKISKMFSYLERMNNSHYRIEIKYYSRSGIAHYITKLSENNNNTDVLYFDPNGKPEKWEKNVFASLNTINLHRANEINQGECGLWALAASVELSKERKFKGKEELIGKFISKDLTKRIAARFINLKQTIINRNNFISLGKELDNNEVEQFLEKGKRFIRPEGFTELMDGQKQILQIKSTPQITTSTRSTSNRAATNLILSHPSNRQYPQALKSSSSDEQLTPTPKPPPNIWREKLNFSGRNTQVPPPQPQQIIQKTKSLPYHLKSLNMENQREKLAQQQPPPQNPPKPKKQRRNTI